MQHENVRTLLADLYNQVLDAEGEHVDPESIPLTKLGVDEIILEKAEDILSKSPFIADVYIDKATRDINPVVDLIVDSYLEHLGVL